MLNMRIADTSMEHGCHIGSPALVRYLLHAIHLPPALGLDVPAKSPHHQFRMPIRLRLQMDFRDKPLADALPPYKNHRESVYTIQPESLFHRSAKCNRLEA